ncbi:hypothetical protein SCMC78_32530 [Streptomyces sp. CMC78]|uniref:Uncharacterized protein n=1 Tax=Streptomyces sp. CMC78 TaxID=3231512 RepID=A0AB33KFM3_9ACTN
MVQDQEQDVLPRCGAEQGRAQRRFGGEVESAQRLGPQRGLEPFLGDGHDRQRGPGHVRVEDALVRSAVRRGEQGAQALVAAGEIAERGVQRGGVQLTGEADGHRHVVRGGRSVDLVDEPEPLLRQ